MAVELNHTIIATHDKQAGAQFLADVLGLPAPAGFGPFAMVTTANGVSLDFMQADEVPSQHYAFLISEDEFDAVAARLRDRGVTTYADPSHRHTGSNTSDGGRGMYFDSPEGHNLEVLTRPYGSGSV